MATQPLSLMARRFGVAPERGAMALSLLEPPRIRGAVQRGRQLGRTLGFPTANVAVPPDERPRLGVYAAWTRLPDARMYKGVASVGCNPTVGWVEPLLEVWLFDFDEDLYGQTIETRLVAFLRDERRFESLAALTEQVRADAAEARAFLDSARRFC